MTEENTPFDFGTLPEPKKSLQQTVCDTFYSNFGHNSIIHQLESILYDANQLNKQFNPQILKTEVGDLLANLINFCANRGWDYEELVNQTLQKIESRKEQYNSLRRKTEVAILGTAANPITNGHIQLAQYVLNSCGRFEEVWIQPCFKHMYGKELVPGYHRLEMCQIAVKNDIRIKVSRYEIDYELDGSTYDIMKKMMNDQDYKDFNFSLIIGMDNANTFHNWKNWQELESMVRFIVVPRGGVKPDTNVNWYLQYPHIYLGNCEHTMASTSSTLFRNLYKTDRDGAKKLVNKEVFDYIFKNSLYGH